MNMVRMLAEENIPGHRHIGLRVGDLYSRPIGFEAFLQRLLERFTRQKLWIIVRGRFTHRLANDRMVFHLGSGRALLEVTEDDVCPTGPYQSLDSELVPLIHRISSTNPREGLEKRNLGVLVSIYHSRW
jgi:hypothetical protein